jgi:hypothetical protein
MQSVWGPLHDFVVHCRYNPLVIYNLANGISTVTAGGETATMNADLGQQFKVPTSALQHNGASVSAQTIQISVADLEGKSYGTFTIPLDPDYVSKECSTEKWAARVEAQVEGEAQCNMKLVSQQRLEIAQDALELA